MQPTLKECGLLAEWVRLFGTAQITWTALSNTSVASSHALDTARMAQQMSSRYVSPMSRPLPTQFHKGHKQVVPLHHQEVWRGGESDDQASVD